MAENQNTPKSSGICKKLYNATFFRCKKSISAPNPALPSPISTTTGHFSHTKAASPPLPTSGEAIPIEFDPRILQPVQYPKEKTVQVQKSFQKTSSKFKKQENINDKFTDYINRVKNRMRTSSSNVGSAKISSRPDSFNDNVSNYISRAQMKMRTSSSSGDGGKRVTFK